MSPVSRQPVKVESYPLCGPIPREGHDTVCITLCSEGRMFGYKMQTIFFKKKSDIPSVWNKNEVRLQEEENF